MKIKDAIALEKRITIEDLSKIYLIPDGDWYRAYEWSAFLLRQIPSKRNIENTPLKVIKKFNDDLEYGLISVGLKETYFPNYLTENFDVTKTNAYDCDISVIDVKNCLVDINFELKNYECVLNEFKTKFEFSENSKKAIKKKASTSLIDMCDYKEVINAIMGFCVLDSTPFECCKFIQTLQKQIIANYSI